MPTLLFAVALGATDPAVVDVSNIDGELMVLDAGESRYLVAPRVFESTPRVFYGNGKTFYELRMIGGGGETKIVDGARSYVRFGYVFWDPRYPRPAQSGFWLRDGRYGVNCDERETFFEPLPADKAKAMLASARFERIPHAWKPYALARNEKGVYFFVDQGRYKENEREFRVFKGRKGNLKRLKLSNIVHDSEGDIFSTRAGDLRMVLGKKESWWVTRGRRIPLTLVPVFENQPMIYHELGPYMSVRVGNPCDDL